MVILLKKSLILILVLCLSLVAVSAATVEFIGDCDGLTLDDVNLHKYTKQNYDYELEAFVTDFDPALYAYLDNYYFDHGCAEPTAQVVLKYEHDYSDDNVLEYDVTFHHSQVPDYHLDYYSYHNPLPYYESKYWYSGNDWLDWAHYDKYWHKTKDLTKFKYYKLGYEYGFADGYYVGYGPKYYYNPKYAGYIGY